MKSVLHALFFFAWTCSSSAYSEEYSYVQAGHFEKICSIKDVGFEGMCISYLAGYRTALQDMKIQSNWATDTLRKRCAQNPQSAACRMNPGDVALEMFEGCELSGMKISNQKVKEMILSYMEGRADVKKEPFMYVYLDAIGDAVPCPSE